MFSPQAAAKEGAALSNLQQYSSPSSESDTAPEQSAPGNCVEFVECLVCTLRSVYSSLYFAECIF